MLLKFVFLFLLNFCFYKKEIFQAEKSASTIHVTILKEEKNLLEKKLYQITQHYEESRLQIDELNRQNLLLQNQKQHQYPIPIQQTIDHRYELDDV